MTRKRMKNKGSGKTILYLFLVATIMAFIMGIVENRYTRVFLAMSFDIRVFLSIFGLGLVSLIIGRLIYGGRR